MPRCVMMLPCRLSLILIVAAIGMGSFVPAHGRAAVMCGSPNGRQTSVCTIDPAIDPAALCNDGTLPAFWVRPGSGSGVTSWVIWLQSGGDCVDRISCTIRAKVGGSSLTSNGFKAAGALGVLSQIKSVNPALYNANTVLVHYCSSDYWSGNYATTQSFKPTDPTTWNFQGRRIALAAIASLNQLNLNFASATRIILGGSSAGGDGITVTVNDILPTLPPAPDIRLVNDAGFSLDIGQYEPTAAPPYVYQGSPNAFQQMFAAALTLWHGRGDAKCAALAASQADQINCYDSAYVLQHNFITIPSFVSESQMDAAQIPDELCPQRYGFCAPPGAPSTATGQYAAAFAADMAATLEGAGTSAAYSVASPDVYEHVILQDEHLFTASYAIPGGTTSPRNVFDAWLQSDGSPRLLSIGSAAPASTPH